MFIIGLTGGIGSGKSTIASWFREWHIPVIDGDKLAREAVNPGSPVLSILADAFGKEILSEEGTLKRRQLGQIVFQDKAKLSPGYAVTDRGGVAIPGGFRMGGLCIHGSTDFQSYETGWS